MGTDTQGGQPEYCIFYGVSDAGTVGFYRYDLTDKTIQRYFEQSSEGNSQSLELQDLAEKYNALVDDYNIARIALVAAAAVAVILLIPPDHQPQWKKPPDGRGDDVDFRSA